MTDPDKHKVEQGIGDIYLAMYREALEERDYYKNLAEILAESILIQCGHEEPTKKQIDDYLNKVGGKEDLL